ncbi:hypothetical protein [Limnohabitans sp. Rim8]|uniref:hypothetical protein n=1 Tax=Limnohabitans sp. Rim8 TaxID=1100718 RepID=UPI00260732D6|nr:hypothetical protein [Limnohabitans sp. Rim8]
MATFKNSTAGADVESGTTTTFLRALLSGLIERMGIPDDRDRSFRRIVTEDSDLS